MTRCFLYLILFFVLLTFQTCKDCVDPGKNLLNYTGRWVPVSYTVNGVDSFSTFKQLHIDTINLHAYTSAEDCKTTPDYATYYGKDNIYFYSYFLDWNVNGDSLFINISPGIKRYYSKDSIVSKSNKTLNIILDTTLMLTKTHMKWHISEYINKGNMKLTSSLQSKIYEVKLQYARSQ